MNDALSKRPGVRRTLLGLAGLALASAAPAERRPAPCAPSETRLCFIGKRYAAELSVPPGAHPAGPGTARPLGDGAGYFALLFATGSDELPEVTVKMFEDGAFGSAGAPLFYASLTTLPYVLTVTDTLTGRAESYSSDPDAPLLGRAVLSFGEAAMAPSSLLDLSGTWTGTISFPSDCFDRCRPSEEIQATLVQNGDGVTGSLATECLGPIELLGALRGDQLTLDFSPPSGTGSFLGVVTSASVHVEKNCDPWGYGDHHTMTIELARPAGASVSSRARIDSTGRIQ